MEFKDKIIGYIEGYKHLHFINHCLVNKDYGRLRDVYSISESDILKTLPYYVKYQLDDYYYYTKISDVIRLGPLVGGHRDLDLEAYVKGLYERNKLVWYREPVTIFDFMSGKKVLDFGCGGGFYTEIFRDLNCEVAPYDRPDIAKVANKWKPDLKVVSIEFEELLVSMKIFDVIWLSEVLHGKSLKARTELLLTLISNMKKGSIIVINELRPDTPLSKMFDYQMKIHCKGQLLKPMDIVHELDSIRGVVPFHYRDTAYHLIYAYKRR